MDRRLVDAAQWLEQNPEGMTMAHHRQTTKQFATQAISLATRALFLATVGLTLSGIPCAQADFFDTFSLNEPLAEHAEPSPFDGRVWPASHASTIESPTESLAPLSQQIPEQTLEQMPVPESVSRMSLPPSPRWTRYAYGEALFLGRDNQSYNQPLLTNIDTLSTVLTTQSMQFPFSEGFRTFYGAIGPECRGWEIGYFGIYGQSATATAVGASNLFLPLPVGVDLDPAGGDSALFKYNSVINSAEANMFHHFTRWNDSRQAWLEVDWLTGFRYIGVEETAALNLVCCGGTEFPSYSVGTRNNMFGGQIGGRARLNWQRWAIEGWGKAAVLGNFQKQYQNPLISTVPFEIRPALSSTGTAVGMVADMNISAIYRMTDVWGIRVGYNAIWLGGLALAPNQFDFTNNVNAGTLLQPSGSMFLHGANLGLEARY